MAKNIFKGLNQTMAAIMANATKNGFTPANLFIEMLQDKNEVSAYFNKNVDIKKLINDFKKQNISQQSNTSFQKKLEKKIGNISRETSDRYTTELKFMTLILDDRKLSKMFNNVIAKYLNPEHVRDDFHRMLDPMPNLTWDKGDATILDALGRNLTQLALDGEISPIVGREEEQMRMIQILTRQTKSNPALVGEAGVGKTALVEKLAFTLLDHTVIPSSLHDYQLYEISIPAIISSGDIEGTVNAMLEQVQKEKVILFMDEVHLIMEQNAKIANLLKPAMARGDVKLIGATTEDEYKAFEKDKAMVRRFQPVKVNEPDKTSVFEILKSKAQEAEEVHNVLIPSESMIKAIQLSDRYIQHRRQPDKAIDLMEEASAKLRMILESKPEPLIEIERDLSDVNLEIEMFWVNNKQEELNERQQEKIDALVKSAEEKTAEVARLSAEYKDQKKLLQAMIDIKSEIQKASELKVKMVHDSNFAEAVKLEIEVLPELATRLKQAEDALLEFAKQTDENLIQNVVTPVMIARIIEDQTGIPVGSQDEDTLEKYRDMEETLNKQVHGQSKPIRLISAAIKRSKAGLSDPNKPLGSFLELGPTGVGKTYLAQKIAEFMFDTDKVMHRFDMSEYMEPHSVARLFGSPPGYVGHDEGGQLTEAIKRNPYSIILFDEIEKAHSKVFDTLLQILDAGRMTDGKGNVIDFKNTIIIMTSNIKEDNLKTFFRPEFLNRIDDIVKFNELDENVII